jgi:predicted RND superfamily exporter protein
MWYRLGQKILQYRRTSLILLTAVTLLMGYFAVQVKLSYEFTKAIPEDNPTFKIYKDFVHQFGVDGTTMVVGFQTKDLYTTNNFNVQIYLK